MEFKQYTPEEKARIMKTWQFKAKMLVILGLVALSIFVMVHEAIGFLLQRHV